MPQKLNSSGKMQDYIPKGNGDASGEYGNNKGTGNKHAKIENGKVIPNIIEESNNDLSGKESKKQEETKQESQANVIQESVKDKIDKVNESSIPSEKIEENIKCGTDEMQDFIDAVFDNEKMKIKNATSDGTCVSPYGDILYLEEGDVNYPPDYEKGQVVYHELGHMIDAYYSEDRFKMYWSSNTIKLSNGKTLQEILRSENTYNKKNGVFASMFLQYKFRKRAVKLEIEPNYDKLVEIRERGERKIDDIFHHMKHSEWEIYKNSPEYQDYSKAISRLNDVESLAKSQMNREYGDLSDIRTSVDESIFGMGHTKSYWRQQGASVKAMEFFAECTSAKATNPKSWELLKKYYPKSTKAYEELCDIIKSRRAK